MYNSARHIHTSAWVRNLDQASAIPPLRESEAVEGGAPSSEAPAPPKIDSATRKKWSWKEIVHKFLIYYQKDL